MDSDGYRTLPKAELHAHLNGCVPAAVIAAVAEETRGTIASDERQYLDVLEAVDGFQDYFRRWALLRNLTLLQPEVRLFASEAARMLAADGVVYAEIRNSAVHIARQAGVAVADVVGWLLEAFDEAAAQANVDLRLVLSITRHEFELGMTEELISAIALHHEHKRLVGVDLAGDEEIAPFPAVGDFFARVKADFGMGVTIHAGEVGDGATVRWALDQCHADRIGHALAAAEDAELLAALADRQVCIEVCLTSNLMTSLISNLKEHPVTSFLDHGVQFVLCSDNPAMHGRSLSHEYALFVEAFGRRDLIDAMYRQQMRFRFGH